MKSLVSIMLFSALAISLLALADAPAVAEQPSMGEEKAEHPRIAAAITALEDAIAYMKEAPHDFGGHKAAAIAAAEKTVKQLHKTLKFREKADGKKGKNK